jgi:hypothetical protein
MDVVVVSWVGWFVLGWVGLERICVEAVEIEIWGSMIDCCCTSL